MKNILITGGGMGNKGAQSMTFICVAELKKRFPDDRIVLLTLAHHDSDEYDFSVQSISYPALKCVIKPSSSLQMLFKRINRDQVELIKALYSNARMVIDISGYALGSNWPDATVDYYLSCIECAEKYKVPVFVMPQSFGPFDYSKDSKMHERIRKTMSYPSVIFAREREGYDLMISQFGFTNVRESCDMVLRCKSADPDKVYKTKYKDCDYEIVGDAIAVIPNIRNFDKKDEQSVLGYYSYAVNCLLDCGKRVYLLHHSKEDASLCSRIKQQFTSEDRVTLIDNDFDCFEYEALVKKFEFILASRYHSIIHALKNGIPCIALGWATKYLDLLNLVGQNDCVLDVRNDITEEEIKSVIETVNGSYTNRKKVIESRVAQLQNANLFDTLFQ